MFRLPRLGLSVLAVVSFVTPALAQTASLRDHPSDGPDPAHPTPLERPANLLVSGVDLITALTELQTRSGVSLVFSPSRLPPNVFVDCDCQKVRVGEALRRLLTATAMEFDELGEHVIIGDKPAVIPAGAATSTLRPLRGELFAVARPMSSDALGRNGFAQQWTLRGTVVEADTGNPLDGAQVQVVGTQLGAVSDAQGRFAIEGLEESEVRIRITMLGYAPATVTASRSNPTVQIELAVQAVQLDRIVVTGTPGATRARAIGTTVAQLDVAEELEVAAAQNVSEFLNARAPGVVLQQAQGVAGGGSRVLIRGRSSLEFAGDPLIYVDGVRVNNDQSTGPSDFGSRDISRLNDIDPDDIESIEIIKGPAASTLYGTEASAGVIQIITKRGREGSARIGLTVRQGATWLPDPQSHVGLKWGVDPSGNLVSIDPVQFLRDERGADFFRTGWTQGYDLNISGGADRIQYYVSAGWDREEGYVPSNTARILRGRANLSFQPRSNLDITASLGITTGRTETFSATYLFAGLYFQPRLTAGPSDGFLGLPPDVEVATQDIFQDVERNVASVQVDHHATDWFQQRLSVGIDLTDQKDVWLVPFVPEEFAAVYPPAARLGNKQINAVETEVNTVDYGGNFSFPLNDVIGSTTSVGFQFYRQLFETQLLEGEQFPAPGVTAIAGITGRRLVSEDLVENVTVGLYVQQQIAFNDRLFLTGALRADDNSAFGAEFDVVTYPKVSASWVLSEEPFFDLGWVEALKLRAAYGESGQQPSAFAAIRTYEPVAGAGDVPTGTRQVIGNPDLGPERGREFEGGFDAAFFGGRLGTEATLYYQRTEDAIVSRQVAPSLGFPGFQFVNAGEVENQGIEALVRVRPVETPAVAWDLTFNISRNWNEVLSLNVPGDEGVPIGNIPNFHRVGYPVASFFGKRVVSAELDSEGQATNVLCRAGAGLPPVPCSAAPDTFFLGQNVPHTEGSASTTLTLFDRLRLSALFDFKIGRKYFSANKAIVCRIFRNHEIAFFPERFDPVDVAYCQGTTGGFFDEPGILGADFAKLRELTVNYRVPEGLAAKIGASRASVQLSARNLLTFGPDGPFDPADPEVYSSPAVLSSNDNQSLLPIPLQFLATLRVTF